MVSTIISGALSGLESYLVSVETDISKGMPYFDLVGFLSSEVKEAKERVRVALKNTGITLPVMRITVNLSPADKRKAGNAYDLPIAVGIMTALGQLEATKINQTFLAGELGLGGEIKKIKGVLPLVMEAKKNGVTRCILPKENAKEGALVRDMEVIGAENLGQVIRYLRLSGEAQKTFLMPEKHTVFQNQEEGINAEEDYADVGGQKTGKRAAEIAAAGFHNLLMIGPPGSGKTMIAKRLPTILPNMSWQEGLEVSAIYSISDKLSGKDPFVINRPFLNPHHTISPHALTGGGAIPKPGVISLAHRGVLFLDELAEFKRSTLDMMRQPMEEKKVHIARNHGTYTYPADFMLVAASNPCPCGYYPNQDICRCSEAQIRRYLSHISGPILDRIDLCVETVREDIGSLKTEEKRENSSDIRKRVLRARKMQEERYRHTTYLFNSQLSAKDINYFCSLENEEQKWAEKLYVIMGLTIRSYHRMLKVARTIADLAESEKITKEHLSEAACYKINIAGCRGSE